MYNSETLCVEESMHVKFDDKELGNETPKQDESVADIQVPEDTPKPDQTAEYEEIPEAEITPEAQDEVASDEAQDGSQQANQSNISHHIPRIKSLETKKVLEEQDHISDKKSL